MPCQHSLGQGPRVILLPGWGFTSQVWLPIATRLATDYQVELWELPGMSSHASLPLAASLDQIIEALLPTLPPAAHYIGWSLGGLIAQGLAIRQPARVRSLVSIGSTPCFLATEAWPGVTSKFFADFNARFDEQPEAALRYFALLCLGSRDLQRQFITATQKVMVNPSPIILQSLHHGLKVLAHTDLRLEADNYQGPTLSLCGSDDPLCPVNPARTQTLIDNATHLPMLTHTDQTLVLLREFLHAHASR